jgi:uncharacterized protein (TIGR02217 family)
MSDDFHEVRFPECLSYGASGGPGFSTTVLMLASGFEQRNINWSKLRCKFDVARTLDTQGNVAECIAFFIARRGRTFGFRFKHWADFQFDTEVGVGTGSEQGIQLFKRYSSGGVDFDRVLNKIVEGSYTVYFNDVAQVEGSPPFVDIDTGELTVTAPAGQTIRVAGEFDVPVRFDIDDLSLAITDKNFHQWGNVPLVELRIS